MRRVDAFRFPNANLVAATMLKTRLAISSGILAAAAALFPAIRLVAGADRGFVFRSLLWLLTAGPLVAFGAAHLRRRRGAELEPVSILFCFWIGIAVWCGGVLALGQFVDSSDWEPPDWVWATAVGSGLPIVGGAVFAGTRAPSAGVLRVQRAGVGLFSLTLVALLVVPLFEPGPAARASSLAGPGARDCGEYRNQAARLESPADLASVSACLAEAAAKREPYFFVLHFEAPGARPATGLIGNASGLSRLHIVGHTCGVASLCPTEVDLHPCETSPWTAPIDPNTKCGPHRAAK